MHRHELYCCGSRGWLVHQHTSELVWLSAAFMLRVQGPVPADAGELGLRVALSVGELPESDYQVGCCALLTTCSKSSVSPLA